jgi:hypothetical protein
MENRSVVIVTGKQYAPPVLLEDFSAWIVPGLLTKPAGFFADDYQ